MKNATGTSMLAQENQAIKRQKLDAGRSRQVTFSSVICVDSHLEASLLSFGEDYF